MLRAFLLALGQLFDRRILTLLGTCVLLSAACFVGAWVLIGWLLTHSNLFETGWLEVSADIGAAVLTLLASWLMLPLIATTFLGLFLEPVARAVEARHYPELPPAPGLALWPALGATLRFLVIVIALNALLLLLGFFPPLYPFAYLLVNGTLLGREYLELVALRRLQPAAARALRRLHGTEVVLLGMATTGLSLLPLVNFVAPVVVTMVFVHRFEAWNGSGSASRSRHHSAAGG